MKNTLLIAVTFVLLIGMLAWANTSTMDKFEAKNAETQQAPEQQYDRSLLSDVTSIEPDQTVRHIPVPSNVNNDINDIIVTKIKQIMPVNNKYQLQSQFDPNTKKTITNAISKADERGYYPVINTILFNDDFEDGDFSANPAWTATSNGSGDGTEDWTIYADPWIYAYGTVQHNGSGYFPGSDSDGGGDLADETLSTSFTSSGTGTLYLGYWLHFRAYDYTSEYFEVLIDGTQVDLITVSSSGEVYQGYRVIDIDTYNDGGTHTLAMHYYADYGYVAAFDDVVIADETILITGDICDDPIVVPSLPYTDNQDFADFNDDYGYSGNDVVYEFTLDECSEVTVSLCNTDPDTVDTYLWLCPGDGCGTTALYTDDDSCMPEGVYGTSEIVGYLIPGTYYVIADNYGYGYDLPYQIDISATSCGSPPANDECANATDLGGSFPVLEECGTTIGATLDCTSWLNWAAVWYSFTVPYDYNDVTIDYCPSPTSLGTAGVILMDDCNCDDYIIYDSYEYVDPCDNETSNYKIYFYSLPGPATYYLPVTTGDIPQDFCFDLYVEEQCQVECPPEAIAEGEDLCYDYYDDTYNSGCNSSDTTYTPTIEIYDGDIYCGTSGTHLGAPPDTTSTYRDTDWYRFDAGSSITEFQFTCVANFPLQLLIINAGTENCEDYSIVASATGNPCDSVMVTYTGTGVYWLWVGPQSDYEVDCDEAEYVAWLYVVPPMQYDAIPLMVETPPHHRTPAVSTVPVEIAVTNFGIGTYTFDVNATITGSTSGQIYSASGTATNVTQADTVTVTLDNFTPPCIEDYSMEVIVSGTEEENPENDTLYYEFIPHSFGYDGYTDGSSYWIFPFNDGDKYATRFGVPSGFTADLTEALALFYSFGDEEAYITPWVALSDADDNPDVDNAIWTGAQQYFGTAQGTYVLYFDLTSIAGQTEDFWVGFTVNQATLEDLGGLRAEGQYAVEDAPDNNRVYYSGNWYLLDDVWSDPTDVYIWCDYDMTGGTYYDGQPYTIDSPDAALLGAGPYDVIVTFANNGVIDISGASGEVTITGPSGVDFNASAAVNVSVADGTVQVDFGDWTPTGSGPTDYTIEVEFTSSSDMDACNDILIGSSFAMVGTIVYEEPFEDDDGGFEADSLWEWGEDSVATYPVATTATKVWGTTLDDYYPVDACASLYSPTFTVPATGGAVAMKIWYQIEAPGEPWDFCNVKISNDDGASFEVLPPYGGYPYSEEQEDNLCDLLDDQDGYCGHSNDWELAGFDISDYAGDDVIISVDFASDAAVVEWGFYLDDFTVIEYPQTCYNYLPGDANMANESWPAQTIGGDVTYLVNYFRGLANDCKLGGFYASADVTGDCLVVGGDVTYLVNYFRGLADMNHCADYEPCWPTPSDVPSTEPSDWPGCE